MSNFPYPGLRPFQRDETDIFFGREEHTDQLIEKLGKTQFIAVIGPSGYGKSSLVRTGLLAGLESGFLSEAGVHWRIAECRPGNRPFLNLAQALLAKKAVPEYAAPFTSHSESLAFLQADLRRGPLSLQELVLPDNTNLLVLVDQFEEIFRYYHQGAADEAAAFVALLLASCKNNIYVVITLRSDFLADCAMFYDLPEALNQGLFLTPRLTRQQLHEAIEIPAKVFGGNVDEHLVNSLLNDIGNNPDQLPLLQHALMRMWNLANAENSESVILTITHYEKIGRLNTVLSKHAEEAYQELNPNQQKIAEILFCNLTEREDGHRDTRRPVKLHEIAEQANVSLEQVTNVVNIFRQKGRSFIILTPDSFLDISHESLIRQWQRLKQWIEKEAEFAELYKRLEDSAYRWEIQQAELWSGIELEMALAWYHQMMPTAAWAKRYSKQGIESFDLAMRFLDESEKRQQQIRQNELEQVRQKAAIEQKAIVAHKTAIRALVAFMVAMALAAWGYWERNQAVIAEKSAVSAQQHAEKVEQNRTNSLFKSLLIHAALLARDEDYANAKQILNQTRELDPDIAIEHRHSRDLLTWFSKLMGEAPLQIYHGADAQLLAVTVSDDGKTIAAAGERGTLVLFDTETGKLLERLQGHTENVQAIVFVAETKVLISAGNDKRIIAWSLETGLPLLEWEAPEIVSSLAISPDGKLLASGGEDNNITLWNAKTSEQLKVLTGHKQAISTNSLAFSPDGKILGSASYDNTARLWFLEQNRSVTLKGHTDKLQGIAFSPDGLTVATCSVDASVRLWNIRTAKTSGVLLGHKNKVFGLDFIDNGKYLVTASQDRTLRIWDTESGITKRVLQGHTAGVTDIIAKKGQIFSSSNDGKVMRWRSALPYQYIIDLPSEPASVAISPNGKRLIVGFADGTLRWYSQPGLKLLWEDIAHLADVQRLAFNADGSLLVSVSLDGSAKLWKVKDDNLEMKKLYLDHKEAINAVTFSPDSKKIVTASYDDNIGIFDLNSNTVKFYPSDQDEDFNSVSFDKTGRKLLTASDHHMRLWSINGSSLTLLQAFPKMPDMIMWAALSPNGKLAASVGRDWLVNVYSTSNSQFYNLFVGHEQTIHRAIFTPDSHQLITASGDATIRFWHFINDGELFSLRLPSQVEEGAPLWDFNFRCTPTGCWLAVPLTRGKLVLYELGDIYKQ
jgi:WD40 repeat protein/energy-coupling factor transporter ATP-binding protein EcfA2